MAKKKIGKLHPLVPPILFRNQVTLLGATPYGGKSRMCHVLAAQLAEGKETMFGQFPPMRVLYCSERDWDMTTTQFAEQGYTEIPENLDFFCVPDIPESQEPAFRANPLNYIAKQMFTETTKYDLVILDTIADFQNVVAKLKTNDYGPVRMSIMKIQKWSIKHHLSVLALAHSPKENENTRYKNPVQRVLGSVAIPASTIALLILDPIDPEGKNEYVRLYQISHVARLEPPLRYFRNSDYHEVSKEEAESKAKSEPITFITEREIAMLEIIPTEWESYKETITKLKTKLEMSDSNIRNYLKRLIEKSQIAIDHNPDNPSNKLIRRFKPN